MTIAFAPFNRKIAAGQMHTDLAITDTATNSRNGCRAST
jgi:hypothetical protein